jgi:tetratricopeptide (TPR) repeat protein
MVNLFPGYYPTPYRFFQFLGSTTVPYTDEPGTQVNQYASEKDKLVLERLIDIFADPPKDKHAWQKITDRNSTRLLTLLNQEAKRIAPVPLSKQVTGEVFARPEFVLYQKEMSGGQKLLDKKDFSEARIYFADQIAKFPFHAPNYTNFAYVCLQLGDYKTAWAACAQAWRIAPQSLNVLLMMTDYFYFTGDYAQAEKTSMLAAMQGDLEPVVIAMLALAQWKQGKQREAVITAQPVLASLVGIETHDQILKELVTLLPKAHS